MTLHSTTRHGDSSNRDSRTIAATWPGKFRLWNLTNDVIENIAGYLPVGIVVAELGLLRGVTVAAFVSAFSETSQVAAAGRVPSAIDLASNVFGAVLGIAISLKWKIRTPGFAPSRWKGVAATILAVGILPGMWTTFGGGFNPRGFSSGRVLETRWNFGGGQRRIAFDSSGHTLNGRFKHAAHSAPGVFGDGVELDGVRDYIDFGRSEARCGSWAA